MKYHKIRNVSLNVCTAEAKIAYNIAFAYTWDYRDEYKKNANNCSRAEISKFITEAVTWCMKTLKCSWDYQKISRRDKSGTLQDKVKRLEDKYLLVKEF